MRYTYEANIFGSEDSTDLDIMIKVESIQNIEWCRRRCDELDIHFTEIYNKKANSNLCVVSDGMIVEVYKGTVDEVNNMLYYTYELHPQNHCIFVSKLVSRNVSLKVNRALRTILSHLSRTKYRPEIKEALRGSMAKRIDTIRNIDFCEIDDLNKNNSSIIEYRKTVAFQIGQSLGLFENTELYTKKSISLQYPRLADLLYRKPLNGILTDASTELAQIVNDFLDAVENNINNRDSIFEVMKK